MKKAFLIAVAFVAMLAAFPGSAYAQKKSANDYDLQKAYEIVNDDDSKALELVASQLKKTPNNAEALMLRCRIMARRGEYGSALADVNEALKYNKPKQTGYFNSTLWYWKATLYDDLGESEKSAEAYKTALAMAKKDNKDNVQSISFDYAQVLYELDRYDEADAIYKEMIAADETDQSAMVGLARNMIEREQYSEAVSILQKCIKYDEDYSSQYKFLMEAYDKLGETDKAIDNAVKMVGLDQDEFSEEVVDVLFKHKNYAMAKIKEANNAEKNVVWQFALLSLYAKSGEYEKIIKEYDALEKEYGRNAQFFMQRARCYESLDMFDAAISEAKKALELEENEDNWAMLADSYRSAEMYDEAQDAYDNLLEFAPTSGYGYYAKGLCYHYAGDDEKALEMYNEGVDIDKDFDYLYFMRGRQYFQNGDKEKAAADFEKIIQVDTVVSNSSDRQYALFYLGREDEAIEWQDKIIEKDPSEATNWYNKACLYSLMGRTEEAVKFLETAFENGYCGFRHIEHDNDFDNIREDETFKALIAKYSAKLEERVSKLREEVGDPKESIITEVPITRHAGGTFEVPCSVNGLSLNMIFDTGASDVTISSVEANFMLKNNYLSEKDIKGKNYYQVANGDIVEGTVITLREVKVGDALLTNVDASVVKSQKAPLLLGQSVMERFGIITIDNINSKLVIKQ